MYLKVQYEGVEEGLVKERKLQPLLMQITQILIKVT